MNLDHPYQRLEPLPRALWLPGLITSAGDSAQRLADLQRWREALAEACLPPPDADFGDAEATLPLRSACGELDLPGLCRGAPALVEQVLRTLLWHLDRLVDLQPRLTRGEAIVQVTQEFREAWQDEKGDWDELIALLQGLGDLANLRWDELRGLLSSREWREAQHLSQQLAQMPELAALIRRLGRAERAARPQALPPQPLDASARRVLGVKVVETRLPGMPGELRGIRHSDRIEGMLGSEAAMLLHPVLHKLWRARRAESRLLTYDSEAVLHDLRPDPAAPPRSETAPPRPESLERGPMIICLDTSGSMRGAPETIAKALTLEAMRTAHRERRGCLLIAFGGEGEIIERELGYTREGLQALLDLMGQGFDGGTDIQGPIELAIERAHQARWASADVLVVSDGEFGCVPATLDILDDARKRFGLRVQGLLIGNRQTLGLTPLYDDVHWVRDGRRAGDQAAPVGFSPGHSKSLTALYFPNALSGQAARPKPA